MLDQILGAFLVGGIIPRIVGAIILLILGWIVALILSKIVQGALRRTGVDARLASAVGGGRSPLSIASAAGTAVFWIVMLFVLVAVLNALNLTVAAGPLNSTLLLVFDFIPRLIGAAILALVAWVIATLLRTIVTSALRAARIDERLNTAGRSNGLTESSGRTETVRTSGSPPPIAGGATDASAAEHQTSLASTLGEVAYWLVWLLFLPAILGALGLQGILAPVQTMIDRALGFLPNILAAAIILVVGLFVARIVQRIVTGLLAAAGADRLAADLGIGAALGGQSVSSLLGMIVYVLIAIPVFTAALDALGLEAITRPISNMLNAILAAIPNIFAAALVLIIAYLVGRAIAPIVANLLRGVGFDSLLTRLGIGGTVPVGRTASDTIGTVVLAAIMIFAAIEAAELLGFVLLATLITQFAVFAANLLLGLIIFAIGMYFANLAYSAVIGSGIGASRFLANVVRAAILVLAGTMALREAGLGNDIVILAFGLGLGAIAIAAAIAFGVGGRHVAGRELERWVDRAHEGTLGSPAGALPPPTGSTPPPASGSSPGTPPPAPGTAPGTP